MSKSQIKKLIYVVDSNGKSLMPTTRNRKVRHWLATGQAHWFGNSRKTIQFTRPVNQHIQPITVGVDLGRHTGISAVDQSNNREYYSTQVERPYVQEVKRNKQRKMYRTQKRYRLRHRQARFDNRRKPNGWLAPTIQHQLDFIDHEIQRVSQFLPVDKIVLEDQPFDIRKLTNDDQRPTDYTKGPQSGFTSLKAYLYASQNGIDPIDGQHYPLSDMVVHHLLPRSQGGTNSPHNLVLISKEHHNNANHRNGVLKHLAQQLRDCLDTRGAYLMNILYNRLPEQLINIAPVVFTAGYFTAQNRKTYGINKSHVNDALVIAGGNAQTIRLAPSIKRVKLRRNNRSLAKFYDAKYEDLRDGQTKSGQELSSGRTSRSREHHYDNQRIYRARKTRKGRTSIRKNHYQLRPHDLVKYQNQVYEVNGVHSNGHRVLLFINCKKKSVAISKVTCVKHINGILETIL